LYAFLTSVEKRVLKKALRPKRSDQEGAQRRYAWSVVFPKTIRVIESSRGRRVGHNVERVKDKIHAHRVLWENPKERPHTWKTL